MGVDQNGNGKQNLSRSKRKQKRLPQVQILYETCKEVFTDCSPYTVPSPDKIEKLASVLDGITQEDVGLRPTMPFFSSARAPTISYMHLFKCDKFSIGIFCLPPSTVIPLHNHPGMTVFSKLLFGSMHVTAYDWLTAEDEDCLASPVIDPKGLKLAKLKVNTELSSPCRPSILYPNDGGNMHRFTAKTACAMLDVLGPPYSDPEGRHCQYFYEAPFVMNPDLLGVKEEDKEKYAWLGERERPEQLHVAGVQYNGPRISTKGVASHSKV